MVTCLWDALAHRPADKARPWRRSPCRRRQGEAAVQMLRVVPSLRKRHKNAPVMLLKRSPGLCERFPLAAEEVEAAKAEARTNEDNKHRWG